MFKSTILVAAAFAMIDKGVLAMGPQGHGLAGPDIGQTTQTNPVVLDNSSSTSSKSNYAQAFAQDWHPDPNTNSPRDASTRTSLTGMRAPVSGEHATTSDVKTSSDVLESSTEGNHSPPKRSATLRKPLSATRASRSSARTFTKRDPQSAYGHPYSAYPYPTSQSPVSEHRLSTLRTLDADTDARPFEFDEHSSLPFQGLHLSDAEMSTLATLSASIATTLLVGILASTFLFTKAEEKHDVKLVLSTRGQNCLDWRTRTCQSFSFAGESVGTMAVF